MTGSLHLNTSKVALFRYPAPHKPPVRCPVHQHKPIACAARLHRTTGSSGSSSDGSDTSTNALRKGPGSLRKKDFRKFVYFFRQASPYIEGHRDKTFVIVIPGEVVIEDELLATVVEDIALLHSLGVRIVLIIGARQQIDELLEKQGEAPQYAAGYRITDSVAMQTAVQAAGASRMAVEAQLSKGPSLQMIRRHARSSEQMHYGPALQTVTGNYVAGKRKGVIGGVDFGSTGTVRFVQADAIRKQLNGGHIVLLGNLAYSAAGEVLNCDCYSVATQAAIDLQADKLFCMTTPSLQPFDLPHWLPISDAEQLLQNLLESKGKDAHAPIQQSGQLLRQTERALTNTGSGSIDFEKWYVSGLPLPLIAACAACQKGVKRAHLVDARMDGALLLELYSRDGVGTMLSADFYEGIRGAVPQDLASIQGLLLPLEERGVLAPRSDDQLLTDLRYFRVAERDAKVLGCAMVKPLGPGCDNELVSELAAFCVHPDYRGSGRGDSLLAYLEQEAKSQRVDRLVLLTTRTADWFEQRGFQHAGPAHASPFLPETRRQQVNQARNSQLYVKSLNEPPPFETFEEEDADAATPSLLKA
ncbi:TPA: hypothetical protein ACH3X3_012313 [Trebouxia sp. C0006]